MDKTKDELVVENAELKDYISKLEKTINELIAMIERLDNRLLAEYHVGTGTPPEVVVQARALLQKKGK